MLNKIAGVQDEESAMEWGVGKVDKDAQEEEKKLEEKEKGRGYHGVTMDDPQLNAELFDRDRFGDPMAGMLSSSKKRKKKLEKKYYSGAAPANRFGIRPGFQWDGVDRGNGFENRWFQARNAEVAKEVVKLRWAQEDM